MTWGEYKSKLTADADPNLECFPSDAECWSLHRILASCSRVPSFRKGYFAVGDQYSTLKFQTDEENEEAEFDFIESFLKDQIIPIKEVWTDDGCICIGTKLEIGLPSYHGLPDDTSDLLCRVDIKEILDAGLLDDFPASDGAPPDGCANNEQQNKKLRMK